MSTEGLTSRERHRANAAASSHAPPARLFGAGNAALWGGPGGGREGRSPGCGLSTSSIYKGFPGAQLVKNPPAIRRRRFDSCIRKIPCRREGLPTPVFLGFPGGSAGKESACIAGDLGLLPGLGIPTPVFFSGEFHGQRSPPGYSPWGRKELTFTFRVYKLPAPVTNTWH